MPLNSLDMGLVGFVDHGTTVPTTQTVGGSALGVVNQGEALSQASLQNAIVQMQLAQAQMQVNQFFYAQPTVDTIFQNTVNGSWPNMLSASQWQSNEGSNIQPTMTNSSMNTKTKTESPSAYKPVTLTLTGQLKPSTLTKVPRAKSSQSTKSKNPVSELFQALNGNGGW